ncbi:urease accessory protein UreH [Sulfobacillus acidophilus TPY]|nr:urease accessory protein UreH [Sulfobacillus acidophilus TPY]
MRPVFADYGHPVVPIRIVGQTPGLKGGDTQRLSLDVLPSTWCHLGSVAAEHVLPAQGRWARQRLAIRIGYGSRLWMASEPLIPHAGARLKRRMTVQCETDSLLAVEEWITGGRIGCGERFGDLRVDSRMTVIDEEARLLMHDRVHIGPMSTLAMSSVPVEAYWSLVLVGWRAPHIKEVLADHGALAMESAKTLVIRSLGTFSEVRATKEAVTKILEPLFFAEKPVLPVSPV